MAQPIAYGADWSARQIFGDALSRFRYTDPDFRQWPLSFVLRYADFPGQQHAVLTKDEYESHLAAGIRSMLIYQRTTRDPDGGEARGREFGRAAVAYARHIGYRAGEPIFATADAPIGSYNLDVAEMFFRGFAAEVRAAGFQAGGYGFRDVIYRLQDRGVVDVLWLCGAESGWRSGIHIYQWNNGRIYPSGVEADLVKQFERIPGSRGRKADMILVKGPGAEVFAVGPAGKRHVKSGAEADAFVKAGVPSFPLSQEELDSIPTVGMQVWNYGLPVKDEDVPTVEFRAAHRLMARLYEQSGTGGTPAIDYDQLAAALARQGISFPTVKELADELDRRNRDGDPKTGQVS